MTEYIILDSNEDSVVLSQLITYCKANKLSYNIDDLFVGNYSTDLITVNVNNFSHRKDVDKIPGYNMYIPFTLEVSQLETDQSALLAFMFLFYDVEVIFTVSVDKDKSKLLFYFKDGVTPFYLKASKIPQYTREFNELLNKKLVGTNPMLKDILQVKPDSSIRRYKGYSIWYCDTRYDISDVVTELDSLIQEGYFYFPWHDVIGRKVMSMYQYKNHPIYTRLIRGPSLSSEENNMYRLDKDVFVTCVKAIQKNNVPTIMVKVDMACSRRILAGCVLSYINLYSASLENSSEGSLQGSLHITCAMLNEITMYPISSSDSGDSVDASWLTITVNTFFTLRKVIASTLEQANRITIIEVKDIQQGVQCRFELSQKGYLSLLLNDVNSYFVAVIDYNESRSYLLPEEEKDIFSQLDTNVNTSKIELAASSMKDYSSYGKNYAHMGVYTIPKLLPGILDFIPSPNV